MADHHRILTGQASPQSQVHRERRCRAARSRYPDRDDYRYLVATRLVVPAVTITAQLVADRSIVLFGVDIDLTAWPEQLERSSSSRYRRRSRPGAEKGFLQGQLYGIEVSPSHRRAGLGLALAEAMKSSFIGAGATKMWLFTDEDNTPAKALYELTGGVASPHDDATYWWQF